MPLPEPILLCTGAGNTVHPSAQWTVPRHLCVTKAIKNAIEVTRAGAASLS